MEIVEYVGGIKMIKILDEEFQIASDELKQSRLNTCSTCSNNTGDSCSLCSCLLVVRTAYVDSFCPEGKW